MLLPGLGGEAGPKLQASSEGHVCAVAAQRERGSDKDLWSPAKGHRHCKTGLHVFTLSCDAIDINYYGVFKVLGSEMQLLISWMYNREV